MKVWVMYNAHCRSESPLVCIYSQQFFFSDFFNDAPNIFSNICVVFICSDINHVTSLFMQFHSNPFFNLVLSTIKCPISGAIILKACDFIVKYKLGSKPGKYFISLVIFFRVIGCGKLTIPDLRMWSYDILFYEYKEKLRFIIRDEYLHRLDSWLKYSVIFSTISVKYSAH